MTSCCPQEGSSLLLWPPGSPPPARGVQLLTPSPQPCPRAVCVLLGLGLGPFVPSGQMNVPPQIKRKKKRSGEVESIFLGRAFGREGSGRRNGVSAVSRFLVCLNLVTLKRCGNRLKTSLLCSSVGLLQVWCSSVVMETCKIKEAGNSHGKDGGGISYRDRLVGFERCFGSLGGSFMLDVSWHERAV